MAGTIVYIGGFEMPDRNAAAHRVLNNAKAWRDIGKNVVFVGTDKNLEYKGSIFDTKQVFQGFTCYAVSYPKGTGAWVKYITDKTPYVEIIEEYADVEAIIYYNFPSVAMSKLMAYCHRKGIKNIADVTEWFSARDRALPFRVIKDLDTWYRMTILHKKMDGLIVISRYLEEYYKQVDNVVRVPTLVDIYEEKWRKDAHKSAADEINVVYAGNPGKKDRLDVLIDGLRLVKRSVNLKVVGISKDQYLSLYPQYEGILSNLNNVDFIGRVSHLDALQLIKDADYSVFFRDADRVSRAGFPTKFAEAITCGTPVITNKTSDLEDYITDGKNGCFVDMKSDSIADTLRHLSKKTEVDKTIFHYERYSKQMDQVIGE